MQASFADAEKNLQLALELSQKLAAAEPQSVAAVNDLADCYIQIGLVRRAQGDRAGAMASFHSALDAARRADGGAIEILYRLADANEKIGDLQYEGGDTTAALESHNQELAIARRASGMDGQAWPRRADTSAGHSTGSATPRRCSATMRPRWRSYLEHNSVFHELAAEDPTSVYYQQELAAGLGRMGIRALSRDDHDLAGARRELRRAARPQQGARRPASGVDHAADRRGDRLCEPRQRPI